MTEELDRRVTDRAEPADGAIRATFLGADHAVRNISASGMLISPYGGASTVGQFLQVSVSLRDIGFSFSFDAEATVVRVESDSIALRFHAISPAGKHHLAAYFARKFSSNLFNVRA